MSLKFISIIFLLNFIFLLFVTVHSYYFSQGRAFSLIDLMLVALAVLNFLVFLILFKNGFHSSSISESDESEINEEIMSDLETELKRRREKEKLERN